MKVILDATPISAVKISTPPSLCSWREEKTVLTGAFYIFIFYIRQREEGFFHIKRKSNGYSTILKRKKDQAE